MDRRERAGDLETALRVALDGFQARVWTALPCIVESFDAERMTVEAKSAIKARTLSPSGVWSWVELPLLVDVPVIYMSGGGFTLTFPIAAGDEALVLFASRCLDAWWQSGKVQVQADLRLHDLSDGMALCGLRSLPRVLPAVSTSAAQLRSDDGQTYIEVAPGGLVRLQATNVQVHAREKYSWDVNGFGERVSYLGDDTWNVHTWKTPRPQDTVTNTASNISPPEIP